MSEQTKKKSDVSISPAQMFSLQTGRWVKIDTKTGRTIAVKETPGRFKSIREITVEEAVRLLRQEGRNKK
ncbi:MAG: hypothetical protein CVT88_02950 [Candidatus Altiarchaeales archaeon HGW-Altiarchaeales-1]|nr:MAG: hypothetical protein CVT89_01930 [Candidatus Altiarchaeales archaeon HGW-Altiarchaeales-2]PKP60440.1 MAG: hypothetical protein CVT88_02950 [Candidatus Altiarchaeales archaeon HGW-Altiarchaeales-1]